MTTAAEMIARAESTLSENPHHVREHGVIDAIKKVEAARRVFVARRDAMIDAATQMDQIAEDLTLRLVGHDIGGFDYGRIYTVAAVGNLRRAVQELEVEIVGFEAKKAEHVRVLRQWREQGRAA